VVEGLLADAAPGGELGGPFAVWAGVAEDRQITGVEIGEALCFEPREHVLLNRFPRHAQ